jgi:hypothetical protein
LWYKINKQLRLLQDKNTSGEGNHAEQGRAHKNELSQRLLYHGQGGRRTVRQAERYPWVFGLDSVKLYLDNPIVIDSSLRSDLDAFQNRDPNKNWAWFVQSTCKVSKHDFEILTTMAAAK